MPSTSSIYHVAIICCSQLALYYSRDHVPRVPILYNTHSIYIDPLFIDLFLSVNHHLCYFFMFLRLSITVFLPYAFTNYVYTVYTPPPPPPLQTKVLKG